MNVWVGDLGTKQIQIANIRTLLAATALRETYEEIGLLPNFVEFAGYLPDHHVITGFRVTPVVGFVNPEYQLRIAKAEVHDVFEVPLDFILDAANHKSRRRKLGCSETRTPMVLSGCANWVATLPVR